MATANLTAARLRELVSYDADTGQFFWRLTRGRAVAGKAVSRKPKDGYQDIKIDGFTYRAHRCAWLFVHGEWPEHEIDHRNGDRSDNRIANLRDTSKEINQQNVSAPRSDNAIGLRGVYKHRDCERWVAQIMVNKKKIYLGLFKSPEEASAAYLAAKAAMHPDCTRTDTKALLGHKTEKMGDLYANPRGAEPMRVKVS